MGVLERRSEEFKERADGKELGRRDGSKEGGIQAQTMK